MSESALEHSFVNWVRSVGGEAVKGPAYQYKGIPDRIAILPHGGTVYVEFKASELCDLEPMQKHWRQRLLESDYNRYFVIDNKSSLEYTIVRCKVLIEKGKVLELAYRDTLPDVYTENDFKDTSIVMQTNDYEFYLPMSAEGITIKHNDELRVGSLFYNTVDHLVYIIKSLYVERGITYYMYELYYQCKDQTSAAPLKFIL